MRKRRASHRGYWNDAPAGHRRWSGERIAPGCHRMWVASFSRSRHRPRYGTVGHAQFDVARFRSHQRSHHDQCAGQRDHHHRCVRVRQDRLRCSHIGATERRDDHRQAVADAVARGANVCGEPLADTGRHDTPRRNHQQIAGTGDDGGGYGAATGQPAGDRQRIEASAADQDQDTRKVRSLPAAQSSGPAVRIRRKRRTARSR